MKLPESIKSMSQKYLLVAVIVAIVCTGIFAATLFFDFKNAAQDRQLQQTTSELRVIAHKIAARAKEAVNGKEYAFAELSQAASKFDSKFGELEGGSAESAGLPQALEAESKVLGDKWRYIKSDVDKILQYQDEILLINAIASRFESSLATIDKEHSGISNSLAKQKNSVQEVILVQNQNLIAHQLASSLNKLLAGNVSRSDFQSVFSSNVERFTANLSSLKNGNRDLQIKKVSGKSSLASLRQIETEFDVISSSFDRMIEATPNVIEAKAASARIIENTPVTLTAANVLLDSIATLPSKRVFGQELAFVSAAGVAISLLSVGWILYRQSVARWNFERSENDKNQKAIQRLLGEISELADGNLASEATVSEEFTGAIADSINFTIEQLRGIVSSINDTTEQISGAAQSTQRKTMELADASNDQAKEILEASSSIKDMAGTMRKMSQDAARSSTVAQSSVEIAKSGARVVKNTIVGMDSIRDQIQDTSKRIKRLGESSQEIGDIVSLITDIADQTNILALNASIQASMAGDAGRGFAVVADEVQRLAERSSSATRQIEALVRTIQTDTNEAVISMEQTTAEVVSGASLTNDAGVALEEIERVSLNISELISEISDAAKSQAEDAAVISTSMDEIKDTTSDTATETMDAAQNMGQLSGMTVDLRESVAGFKLPEHVKGSSAKYSDIPTVTSKLAS